MSWYALGFAKWSYNRLSALRLLTWETLHVRTRHRWEDMVGREMKEEKECSTGLDESIEEDGGFHTSFGDTRTTSP